MSNLRGIGPVDGNGQMPFSQRATIQKNIDVLTIEKNLEFQVY